MNARVRLGVLVASLLVAPTSATLVEYTEAQHTGENVFMAELASAAFYAEGGRWQDNSLLLEANELIVRSSSVDSYLDTGPAGSTSGPPNHDTSTLHNVRLESWPNHPTAYLDCHAIESAQITYHSGSATSVPSKQDSHRDITMILMPEPQTTDVSEALQVGSSDRMESFIEGGVSLNLWGWTVRITSDEGTYEYETGPSRDVEGGPASVGSATQIQVESDNATVSIAGNFNDVHRVWMHNAVAESDRMDLKLTREDLPTDQEVFNERSRLTVLDVSDTVTGNITDAPESSSSAVEDDSEVLLPDGGGASGLNDGPGTIAPAQASPGASAWITIAVLATVFVVFFVVRQTKGWPVHAAFVRRCESLHDQERYFFVSVLSTIGHWLRPQETRHRFHRGLARMEQEHWTGARRDLVWAAKHEADPEGQAVCAYSAARAAARSDRPAIAGDMLATAARINEQFLWDAQNDPAFRRMSGTPDFEARLASGLS